MGTIIRNGIEYGGGISPDIEDKINNAKGIELTQAEYDALPEEEQKTGLYWITDADSGSNPVDALTSDDVVDSLESTATDLPASANIVKKLNDKLEWKLIGSVVGIGNPIYLPIETYSEFLIITGTPVYKWSRHITKNELNTFVAFNDSFYHPTMVSSNSPSAQFVRAQITASNEISLAEVWQNGAKNDESGTLVAYGR